MKDLLGLFSSSLNDLILSFDVSGACFMNDNKKISFVTGFAAALAV